VIPNASRLFPAWLTFNVRMFILTFIVVVIAIVLYGMWAGALVLIGWLIGWRNSEHLFQANLCRVLNSIDMVEIGDEPEEEGS